ncbi:MAG: molybdopterin molybdenumtransferase MoeA [Phycisphaera sp.]|nr:molybdopterin molybdenumtransferase MoeA [Phycisphaera sp.]
MSTPQTQPDRSAFAFESPAAALDALLQRIEPVAAETVPWQDARGRVLAEPIVADRPSPAADVSSMDGYAVRVSEAKPGQLDFDHTSLPGRPAPPLPVGKAMRIMTGAVVPDGADCVIRREDVGEHDDHITITADTRLATGQNIRRRGENIAAGDAVVPAGVRVTAAVTAALATFGVTELRVRRALRVAMMITGDEVLDITDACEPWQIRDSNGPTLDHLLASHLPISWTTLDRAVDEYDKLRDQVRERLAACDALLVTGGVSMGTHDFVPDVLRELGCEVVFHKLPIRPGKPVLGAVGPRGQLVMGLPGNPMSVLCTARRLALPALWQRAGLAAPTPRPATVTLDNADDKSLNLWWHRIVRTTGPGRAELVATKGSGDVASMSRSDGIVEVPPDESGAGPWPYYAW